MEDKVLIQSWLNRVFHWLFAFGVILLITSGFYIYRPITLENIYDMGNNLLIHSTVAFFTSGVFFTWVYHHIITQSYRDVLFRLKDITDFKGLLKYYLFIETKAPVHGKYNAGQKFIYTSWFFAFIFMFITGIILYMANFGNILPFPVLLQKVRLLHFIGALWFLGTVPVHIYLAFTEDPAKLQAIFTGWVRKRSDP